MLRGWGNYHRHVVASEAFSCVDTYVYEQLWQMLRRRHPNKSKKWLVKKYWSTPGHKWVFSTTAKTKSGKRRYMVQRLSSIGICRHIKVKAEANPYMPEYGGYFWPSVPSARPSLASFSCPFGKRISRHGHIIEVQQPGRSTRASFWNA